MIFCSKNEDGVPAWKLIIDGKKTVTRRLKPVDPGNILAVQPNRCMKAVGYIRIKSCCDSIKYLNEYADFTDLIEWKQREAQLEGFNSWDGLMRFFQKHNIQFGETYRLEFEYIGVCKP